MQTNDYVYFILNKDKQLVKIGHTKNPTKRLWQLQSETKDRLEFAAIFSSVLLERSLHDYFAEERVEGEWFTFSSRLLETIKRSKGAGKLVLPHYGSVLPELAEVSEDILPFPLKKRISFYFRLAKNLTRFDIELTYTLLGYRSTFVYFVTHLIRRIRRDN